MRIQISVLALVAVGFVFAAPRIAQADYIDFTDIEFSADYQPSFNVTTWAGDLNFMPSGDNASLYWDDVDGYGVRSAYEDDEIEAGETLTLSFMSGPVYLDSVSLTDLFYEGGGYMETGSYQLNNDGQWIYFSQDHPQYPSPLSNGEYHLAVGADGVTSITFQAPGYMYVNGQHQGHEYSVAGVTVHVPVPEPGTLALVGLGLAFNAVAIRRRRSRSAATRSPKTL